jgi:hypothetical protein
MNINKIIYWLGKLFILGVILYFGFDGIVHPETFAQLIPTWLTFIPAATLVVIHGVVLSIAALFAVFNIGGKWTYGVIALALIAVLISVSGKILARDIAILGAVFVLAETRKRV